MDRAAFDAWVESELTPTVNSGGVVILDNLAVHRSAKVTAVLRAWFSFLPTRDRLRPESSAVANSEVCVLAGEAQHQTTVAA